IAIAAGGSEDRSHGRGIASGCGEGFRPGRKRNLDDFRRAAALIGWQQSHGREDGRHRHISLRAPQNRPAFRPAFEARTEETYTFQIDADHAARPSTTLQFTPPKPNALQSTRLMRSSRPERMYRLANAGSTFRV